MTKYEESLKKILVFYLAVKSVLLGWISFKSRKKSFSATFGKKKFCEILHFLMANRHFIKSYLVLTKNEESLKKFLVYFLAVKSV